MKSVTLPKPAEVVREAAIIVAGSIVAAWFIGQFPQLKAWMRRQWEGSGK